MVYDGDLEDALHWYLYKSSSGMLLGRSSETLYIDYIEGPCLTRFGNSRRCPGMRFWYEVMSRHSVASCAHASSCCSYDHVQTYYILLLGSHPAATIILLHPITSVNLPFLFHSYCLYLVHWLPMTSYPDCARPGVAKWCQVAQPVGQRWVTRFAKHPAMMLIRRIVGAAPLPGGVDDAITDAILQAFPWDGMEWIGTSREIYGKYIGNIWEIYGKFDWKSWS